MWRPCAERSWRAVWDARPQPTWLDKETQSPTGAMSGQMSKWSQRLSRIAGTWSKDGRKMEAFFRRCLLQQVWSDPRCFTSYARGNRQYFKHRWEYRPAQKHGREETGPSWRSNGNSRKRTSRNRGVALVPNIYKRPRTQMLSFRNGVQNEMVLVIQGQNERESHLRLNTEYRGTKPVETPELS